LHERIHADGPLPFPAFMEIALYESGLGYYARGTRQVGRGGDFFTSVSVGPLFGELLARRFLRQWRDAGSPERWRIIECGAHDGKLAADVISGLSKLEPHAFQGLEYVIPEPLAALQVAQRKTLDRFPAVVRFLTDPEALAADPLPGLAFGNELLDALPCHVVEWHAGRWLECRVGVSQNDDLVWETVEITDPLLKSALIPLGRDFPDGYRTEVRTCYRSFLEPLVRGLESGLMLWIDYGFARPEYYHPARRTGTLRTFSNHQAGENPLENPGETDISAHVDFTAVAEAAASLGGHATEFRNQGAWLTEVGREWLLAQDGNPQPSSLRQFQTLIHPGHLGRSFHVLELSWNPAVEPRDPAALAHRLFGS
jgi:SAM-dependent MidA family methyltransferase